MFYSIYITIIANSLVRIAELLVLVFCFFLFIFYIISMIYFGIGCAHVDLFRKLENLFRCGFRKTGRKHLGLYFVNNCSDWRNWLEVFYQKTDKFITFTIISKGYFTFCLQDYYGVRGDHWFVCWIVLRSGNSYFFVRSH